MRYIKMIYNVEVCFLTYNYKFFAILKLYNIIVSLQIVCYKLLIKDKVVLINYYFDGYVSVKS